MQYKHSRSSEIRVTLGGILLCAVVALVTFVFARLEPPTLLTPPAVEFTNSETG